jgi:hypothetical protein
VHAKIDRKRARLERPDRGGADGHRFAIPPQRIEVAGKEALIQLERPISWANHGRKARGYRAAIAPLPPFLRSGGSAFCLTLQLDRRSVPASDGGSHRGRVRRLFAAGVQALLPR